MVLTDNVDANVPTRLAQLVDFDADGLVDVMVSTKRSDGSTSQGFWRNTGTGWQSEPQTSLPGIQFDYSSGSEVQRARARFAVIR